MEDEDAFDEEVDTLKFRLVLRPETDENNQASAPQPQADGVAGQRVAVEAAAVPESGSAENPSALPLHRLMIQTVGGRSCSQVRSDYGCSCAWPVRTCVRTC